MVELERVLRAESGPRGGGGGVKVEIDSGMNG